MSLRLKGTRIGKTFAFTSSEWLGGTVCEKSSKRRECQPGTSSSRC